MRRIKEIEHRLTHSEPNQAGYNLVGSLQEQESQCDHMNTDVEHETHLPPCLLFDQDRQDYAKRKSK